jgi:hypothetical protein
MAEGAAAPVVNDLPVAEAQPAELEPQGRPGEGMAPMQGQNVLVLGLGASGLAMARWCVRCGAQVRWPTRAKRPHWLCCSGAAAGAVCAGPSMRHWSMARACMRCTVLLA